MTESTGYNADNRLKLLGSVRANFWDEYEQQKLGEDEIQQLWEQQHTSPLRGIVEGRDDKNDDISNPNHPILLPFNCSCHGISFQNKPDLNRHIAEHTRKFECEIHKCPSTGPDGLPPCFGTENDKKRHYRDVHNMDSRDNAVERFFRKCKRFIEGFPRRQNLESHPANIHDGVEVRPVEDPFIQPGLSMLATNTQPAASSPMLDSSVQIRTPGSPLVAHKLILDASFDKQAPPSDEKDDLDRYNLNRYKNRVEKTPRMRRRRTRNSPKASNGDSDLPTAWVGETKVEAPITNDSSRITGIGSTGVIPGSGLKVFSDDMTRIQSRIQSISLFISRKMRPRLQKDYSRIEWICSCGDMLYADQIETRPGSLQKLAIELGGKVIAGPAAQSVASSSAISPSTVTRPADIVLSQSTSGLPTERSVQWSTSGPRSSRTSIGLGSSRGSGQSASTSGKWLELCIRSGPDTHNLGEIDVAGRETDHYIFDQVRLKYRDLRKAGRFGGFALRIPNGGVFVMFRVDKLCTTSSPPTASILMRSTIPKPDEARAYKYVYDPVPMDEPPMDPRTFNHYFHKPHLADSAATWVRRFPRLHAESLSQGTEKLAKGWGIEITEDRNWTLFAGANAVALAVGGVVAVLAACYTDRQTGVAVGAWLSAVQTLVVTALFWHWTS